MLTSITLQNFKSFGKEQVVPLQPISVLVGPNNSGKSSFMDAGIFGRVLVLQNEGAAFAALGHHKMVMHRPAFGSGDINVGWETPEGSYQIGFLKNSEITVTLAPAGDQSRGLA